MTFVNEHILQEDVKKYDLEAIDKKFIVGGTSERIWTIDRERNIYLRNVTRGREEYKSQSDGCFFGMVNRFTWKSKCLTPGASRGGWMGAQEVARHRTA